MGHTEYKKQVGDELWRDIRFVYENEKISFNKLAKRFAVHPKRIARKAKDEKWEKFKPFEIDNTGKKVKTIIVNPNGILGTVAVRKISEILKELKGHYSPVDEPLVVAYAKNYQRYLELEAIVDDQGVCEISTKTGTAYLSPYFNALQAVTNNLQKLGDKLGLSIAARKKLGILLEDIKEDKAKSLFELVDEIMTKESDANEV